jgi:hypothetical protein
MYLSLFHLHLFVSVNLVSTQNSSLHIVSLSPSLSLSPSPDDHVIITEQTLDQHSFIVINERTGDKGRVPVDYIRIGKFTEGNECKSVCSCLELSSNNVTSVFTNLPNSLQIELCRTSVCYGSK